MEYKDIRPYLDEHINDTVYIDFKEYSNVSYNTKAPVLEINGYEVVGIYGDYEVLSLEDIYKHYGENGLMDYGKYMVYPYIRLIIKEPGNEEWTHIIHLSKGAFETGHQEIKLYTTTGVSDRQPRPWVGYGN